MKKMYILALALGAFTFSSSAQVELTDDFDSYTLGDISAQASHWRTWSGDEGGAEDADVTDDYANSDFQSMYIDNSGLMDEILLIPSAPTSGTYTVQWYALIPEGKSGYFNMQATISPAGTPWTQALMGGNVYFNCDAASPGSGGVSGQTDCTAFDEVFAYPEDQWFKVTCIYDIDNQTWSMKIDDVEVFSFYPFAFGTQTFVELAGIDFWSANATNEMYIDDVVIANGTLATEDFAEEFFKVYPNPVKDVLNITSNANVDSVTVYDLLGKLILTAKPETVSPSIDMSNLTPGAYLVKVTIGNASKTIKIIK